ncbi:poly [ADP-ribose] polymerase 3 [Patagioenas fasciata monilis]|uniref:Poly [ADP-ribose] polymerase n=1 Tax=Patagioenas fasciata monilis TaxID=372326 RepID=A0A1V4K8V1_PATFA|nr:poly [ADP-ribose] polymerase 3 [Patagioenas fasciata monilis]
MVAAILKSGLRIMLHLGGHVGKGIYSASENSRSASYVSCTSEKAGIMFLTEVALGKPYCTTCDDPTLCQPPTGFHSILACGRTELDPTHDEEVLLDGRKVLVCQGKPTPMPTYKNSSFRTEQVHYLSREPVPDLLPHPAPLLRVPKHLAALSQHHVVVPTSPSHFDSFQHLISTKVYFCK